MNQEQVLKLLAEVSSPISRIEEKLGMPKSTLQNVVNGKRTLSKEWSIKFQKFIERKEYIGLKRKPRKVEIVDLTKPTEEINEIKQPQTNFTIDNRRPFMNDEIKKKLGIK